MRDSAWINNQDILHWYKTPEEMKFTEKGYPVLEKSNVTISRRGIGLIIPFNYALNYKGDKSQVYVHFYIQDYQFNRIWNTPDKYIQILKQYKGIIMPDFSLYYDMPLPLQQFNHYRNLWFARMCQIEGIKVIASPNWSDYKSFDFCFEGLPKNDIIMLSTIGSTHKLDSRDNFYEGLDKMIEVLTPKTILVRSTKNVFESLCKTIIGCYDLRFVDCNFN